MLAVSDKKALIINKLEKLSNDLLDEVVRFISFIEYKEQHTNELYKASETTLAKEWLSKEEDAVWQDL